MKKLNFSFKVQYSFSQPVTEHYYALRILPETNEEQGIYAAEYRVFGGNSCPPECTEDKGMQSGPSAWVTEWERAEGCGSTPGTDGFGNRLIAGRVAEAHNWFAFEVTGTAYVRRDRLRKQASFCAPMYRFPTDLTRPGETIGEFFAANRESVHRKAQAYLQAPGGETRGRALEWMYVLKEHFSYVPGVTNIRTTAEEAMVQGRGVCQDYAHILIVLLRMDGIPARYIAGMLIGEGATHAWCEAWCEGYWLGLDPTHGCWLTEDYIEVARGRDYRDCIMDRGCFRGPALQSQKVSVIVEERKSGAVNRFGIL